MFPIRRKSYGNLQYFTAGRPMVAPTFSIERFWENDGLIRRPVGMLRIRRGTLEICNVLLPGDQWSPLHFLSMDLEEMTD